MPGFNDDDPNIMEAMFQKKTISHDSLDTLQVHPYLRVKRRVAHKRSDEPELTYIDESPNFAFMGNTNTSNVIPSNIVPSNIVPSNIVPSPEKLQIPPERRVKRRIVTRRVDLGSLGIMGLNLEDDESIEVIDGLSIIHVETLPDGMMFILDGEPYGITPLTITNVVPGEHEYILRNQGFEDYTGIIDVMPYRVVHIHGNFLTQLLKQMGKLLDRMDQLLGK